MMDVGRHPKIELMTYSEVEHVTGYIGNFKVTIRKKARYVDEKECNACAECVKVCPVVTHDAYQMGFSSRKAIYLPFPQAVPSSYLIDMEACLGNNPIACAKCQEVCEKNCIDFDAEDELVTVDVGAIIVAVGNDVYDPTELDEYGYRSFENVITSMEFERLICAGGPTEGHFIRPGDRKRPKSIGFIQCVGSRSKKRGNPYCSNICCMNTIKDTVLLKDHYPDVDVKVFYMDIRAFGKGFEDLYMKSKDEGVHYIRGLPGEVEEDPETGNLIVTVENTTTGKIERHELELLVLSVGLLPRKDSDTVRQLLTLSRTSDGFLMESHPKLKPVDAPTRGVFLAGCAESPKDVKDSVTQASAAASRANVILSSDRLTVEAITAHIDPELCTYCGLCVKVCPYKAITPTDRKKKIAPQVIEAACAGCGTCGAECPFGAITMRHFTDGQIYAQIDAILEENPQDKVVVFACNWCSYAGGDFAGISRLQYPTSPRLIRTMCSGRVKEDFVLHAFRKGAPIVLVSGCHFADCHYIDANRQTQLRVYRLWDKLEKNGIRPERLQLEWISAAEAQKFAVVMKVVEEMRQKVTAEEIQHTMEVLAPKPKKKPEEKEKATSSA
ncbi:MAG: methyl-viologen-reducing hydrogenase subunit delta [Latescibacteria bacterium DG_63]|nr:MAG: methyl-viologen-reducing hydrogenase subunit delta [Latescibacteria bacterium DG_63]